MADNWHTSNGRPIGKRDDLAAESARFHVAPDFEGKQEWAFEIRVDVKNPSQPRSTCRMASFCRPPRS